MAEAAKRPRYNTSDYDRKSKSGSGDGDKRQRGRKRRKPCSLCVDKLRTIDYKDAYKLRRFITERGKLVPRRVSGNCAQHQRRVVAAVKRSRHVALLPFTTD